MADQYGQPPTVYDNKGRAVSAQWLVDAKGGYVIDPITNQPYVVPAGFDLQQWVASFKSAGTYANNLSSNVERSGFITGVLLGFAPGGEYDIQRSYGSVVPGFMSGGDRFVSSFTNSASFLLGVAGNAIGLPQTDILQGGGMVKLFTATWENFKTLGQTKQTIGSFSDWFNSASNATNIRTGYSYVDSGTSDISGYLTPTQPTGLGTSRDSTSYFTTSDDSSVIIKSGGTISDIWWSQRNNANGFSNDKEF
ncbi:MAG: hypothetical protein HY254_08640, partial [Burkholderiales bacterium]|nr:hypothetical protein [Burkholderiales bacterium]